MAKRILVVPTDMVFCPRKNIFKRCCPAHNHTRVQRERMLTHFFLGLLRSLGWLDTVYRRKPMDHRALNSPFFDPPPTPWYPANGFLLFHDSQTQLISDFSRMHLWPGGNPDYTFNGTSCFLSQEHNFLITSQSTAVTQQGVIRGFSDGAGGLGFMRLYTDGISYSFQHAFLVTVRKSRLLGIHPGI